MLFQNRDQYINLLDLKKVFTLTFRNASKTLWRSSVELLNLNMYNSLVLKIVTQFPFLICSN